MGWHWTVEAIGRHSDNWRGEISKSKIINYKREAARERRAFVDDRMLGLGNEISVVIPNHACTREHESDGCLRVWVGR